MAKTIRQQLQDGTIRLHDKKKERYVWFTPGDLCNGGAWVTTGGGNRIFIDIDDLEKEWCIG